jgi:hypothetical protein
MSALTFLNPAYLGALALGFLPILIHLIRRRKVRVVEWAAWDFLLQSKRRNRRRLRLEQLLLLLLRITIVCLAVLAFTRPLMRSLGLPMVSDNARVHALIVVDNSLSMAHKREGVTEFDRAKRVADDLLARVLKQGDSASILLLSSEPQPLIGRPTFDLARAREKLRTARISDRATNYGAGFSAAADLLKDMRTPVKEVYWISDSQAAGFPETGKSRAQDAWKRLSGLARVTWVDVGGGERANVSVSAPVFSRELVTPQSPVRIDAAIQNRSRSARNGLLVNLMVDGRQAGSARVNVPANGAAKASFVYLFEKPGPHSGVVQVTQPDALERDNSAYFAVNVRDKLKVLVLNPAPAKDPARDEAFYFVTALSPAGATEGAKTAIQTTVLDRTTLTGVNLRAYDAVTITGLTSIAPNDGLALREYVTSGGGLLIFPGPGTEGSRAAAGLASGERFLPAKIGPRRAYPEDTAPRLNAATIAHPALLSFRDTSELDLGAGRFSTVYDLTPDNDNSVRTVLKFSGGQPAFVERRVGQGKVILAAAPAGASGGSLPFKPAYVPLIHQIVAYLAAGPTAQQNLGLGQPMNARFEVRDTGKPVRVTDPSGQTALVKTTLGAEGVLFRSEATDRAGLYRLSMAGRPNAGAFAVNLPETESDLAALRPEEIRKTVGPGTLLFSRGTDDILSVVRQARKGTELWRNLIMAILPLLFLEAVLAQRWGRRG